MSTPAENAAAVRDALHELPIVPDAVFVKRQNSLAALDALEAQAEQASDPDYSPEYQDEYQRLWHRSAEALKAAEAERDRLRGVIEEYRLHGSDWVVKGCREEINRLAARVEELEAAMRDAKRAFSIMQAQDIIDAALDKDTA